MAFDSVPLLGMIKTKMSWLGARQEVLAQNIANAETPGYGARDLTRPDFRQMLDDDARTAALRRTSARHMGVERVDLRSRAEDVAPWETVLDGNAVSVEQEMMRVSETVGEYRLATNLYSKSVGLLRTALGTR